MPFDQPGAVVKLHEGQERQPQFLYGREDADPEQVSLQRTDEPLGTAVALRFTDEGGRALDAQESQFILEDLREIGAARTAAQGQPRGDLGRIPAEALPHALAHRLKASKRFPDLAA